MDKRPTGHFARQGTLTKVRCVMNGDECFPDEGIEFDAGMIAALLAGSERAHRLQDEIRRTLLALSGFLKPSGLSAAEREADFQGTNFYYSARISRRGLELWCWDDAFTRDKPSRMPLFQFNGAHVNELALVNLERVHEDLPSIANGILELSDSLVRRMEPLLRLGGWQGTK